MKTIDFFTQEHGTLQGAYICDDGIVLISDSRSNFSVVESGEKKLGAYYDKVLKVFPIGHYQIAKCGANFIGNKYIGRVVADYNLAKKGKYVFGVQQTLEDFRNYVNSTLRIDIAQNLGMSQYILAGYEQGHPKILHAQEDGIEINSNVGTAFVTDPNFDTFFKQQGYTIEALTCAVIGRVTNQAFIDYSQAIPEKTIGGPNYVIQIKPDNSVHVINSFVPVNFRSAQDYIDAITKGTVDIKFLKPEYKEVLLHRIASDPEVRNKIY